MLGAHWALALSTNLVFHFVSQIFFAFVPTPWLCWTHTEHFRRFCGGSSDGGSADSCSGLFSMMLIADWMWNPSPLYSQSHSILIPIIFCVISLIQRTEWRGGHMTPPGSGWFNTCNYDMQLNIFYPSAGIHVQVNVQQLPEMTWFFTTRKKIYAQKTVEGGPYDPPW